MTEVEEAASHGGRPVVVWLYSPPAPLPCPRNDSTPLSVSGASVTPSPSPRRLDRRPPCLCACMCGCGCGCGCSSAFLERSCCATRARACWAWARPKHDIFLFCTTSHHPCAPASWESPPRVAGGFYVHLPVYRRGHPPPNADVGPTRVFTSRFHRYLVLFVTRQGESVRGSAGYAAPLRPAAPSSNRGPLPDSCCQTPIKIS